MVYDVLVAGAGPAGSTAARVCAENGLKVAVFDRAEFPREKPCGGGVNLRAAKLLPFDISPVVERKVDSMRFSLRGQHDVRITTDRPFTYMTQRSQLDTILLEHAIQAGASSFERCPVEGLEFDRGHVQIRTGDRHFRGRVLIAADGVNGRTGRMAGFSQPAELCVGLEANLPLSGRAYPQWERTLAIDYGRLPGGYGWVFPKGEWLNLGVYGWRSAGIRLRDELARLARSFGWQPEQLVNLSGYHLPMRWPGAPVVKGNTLLAGDAAGLVDPLMGEGIFAAIWSGQAAAQEAAAYLAGKVHDLNGYQQRLEAFLGREQRASRRFMQSLNLLPRIGFGFLHRVPGAGELLASLARGELDYQGLRRALGPLSLGIDIISYLSRFFPVLHASASLGVTPPPNDRYPRERNKPTGRL